MFSEVSSLIEIYNVSKSVTFIYIYSEDSTECIELESILTEITSEFVSFNFIKVKASGENKEILNKLKITVVPTILFIKEKEEVDRVEGFLPKILFEKCSHYSQPLVEQLNNKEFSLDLFFDIIEKNVNVLIQDSMEDDEKYREIFQILKSFRSDIFTLSLNKQEQQILFQSKMIKNSSKNNNLPLLIHKRIVIGDYDKLILLNSSQTLEKILKDPLAKRIYSLINSSPIMLFMKGTPDEPFCKFSKATMNILSECEISFGYFDIFTDEDIREGLKVYSNWPTYPQLYKNGELIGGFDIIKELYEANQLKEELKL